MSLLAQWVAEATKCRAYCIDGGPVYKRMSPKWVVYGLKAIVRSAGPYQQS